tara:strand:+ start:814 stop:1044 length:231 start_codon:yes stop_codon:yes gene_type:complete
MTQTNSIENIKDWFTFAIAVITCVAGVIFWVQSSNDPIIEKLEKEITILRQDIQNIRDDNNKILRIVGRLEGKLEN